MPDLLDDLRCYGEAVESAASARHPDDYLAAPASTRERRSRRAFVVVGAAVALLVVLASAVVVRDDRKGNVSVDTPPTVIEDPPEPIPPTSIPTEPLGPITTARELPTSSAAWATLDPGPLSFRAYPAVVWTGDRMIFWGGAGPAQDDPLPELADGASYNPNTDTWASLPPAPLSGRALTVSAWTGTEMLVWGGGGGNTGWKARADGAAYNPSAGSWRTLPAAPLPAGPLYSGAWTGDQLVVVGASADGLQSAAYDPVTDAWRSLPSIAFTISSPGSSLDVSWTGSRLVVMESFPSGGPTQAIIYDPTTDRWSVSRPDGFSSRSIATAVLDGRLYAASYMQDFDGTASLDPVTGIWDGPVTINAELSCEGGNWLVAMNSSLFAVGCGLAGIYDPVASTWQPLTYTPVEPGCQPPALVWTGQELLCWGPDQEVNGAYTTRLRSLRP